MMDPSKIIQLEKLDSHMQKSEINTAHHTQKLIQSIWKILM